MALLPKQETILPIIQLSITPVILISGIGALLLSMTNRMGRIVDRSRILAGIVRQSNGPDRSYAERQLIIMYRRAKLMRMAMTLATSSMFVSGLLIVVIFVSGLYGGDLAPLVLGFFIASIGLLLGGLGAFIRDVFLSLHALGVEVDRALATLATPPTPSETPPAARTINPE